MDMAEVGRQQRHVRPDIDAVSIPAEQGAHGEAVAQIMRPRPASRRARLQSSAADQTQPGEVGVVVTDAGAGDGDEQRRVPRPRAEFVAAAGEGGQRADRAGVQRDLPGLAELGLPDVEHTVVEVDVVAVEPEGSPMRSPVTASSPTKVSKVAARSGEASSRAAAMRAAMSASAYKYGTALWLRAGSSPAGGTSWTGSIACK